MNENDGSTNRNNRFFDRTHGLSMSFRPFSIGNRNLRWTEQESLPVGKLINVADGLFREHTSSHVSKCLGFCLFLGRKKTKRCGRSRVSPQKNVRPIPGGYTPNLCSFTGGKSPFLWYPGNGGYWILDNHGIQMDTETTHDSWLCLKLGYTPQGAFTWRHMETMTIHDNPYELFWIGSFPPHDFLLYLPPAFRIWCLFRDVGVKNPLEEMNTSDITSLGGF